LEHDAEKLDLFLTYRSALVDYVTPMVGDKARAEDVVQEAFIRFVPAGGGAGPTVEQPVAYLYRVVRNLALDWVRRRALERRQEEAEPLWWMVPATPRTPEQELAHREALARTMAALEDLPHAARVAFEMHRFGGHTLQEIARRLGVSVPTAHRLVRDALVRIAGGIEAATDD
jgi:RNA polymerase sigma-70 factor (ECF subfamily)